MTNEKLLAVARGDQPADLLLTNVRVVNVYTNEIVATDIAIAGDTVAGFGPRAAVRTLDLEGRFAAPGFIDAHLHIESTMVTPAEYARAVVPRGTTAVVADPHEIANVMGTAGLDYMLGASEGHALQFFFTLSSCVPATRMETAGAALSARDLAAYVGHPRMVGLAEMMNYPGVVQGDEDAMGKIALAGGAGIPVDGHAPGLTGPALQAYRAAGIGSDHECTRWAEAREKLRLGFHIMVREGTGAKNLAELVPLITPDNAHRFMWCTDDRHPHDLLAEGHIDALVRAAIRRGLDPVTAIRVATLSPASYFRLPRSGAIAPGKRADLVILDDLETVAVDQVYAGGRLTAQSGRMVDTGRAFATPIPPISMRIAPEGIDLKTPADGGRLRVIEIVPDQIITRAATARPTVCDRLAVADPQRDLLKIAVVERHRGSGRVGIGFVRGMGLKRGAMASSVAHDAHNIVAVGADDGDMQTAVAEIAAMGGGLAVVDSGRVRARLELPIGGLMSPQSLTHVDRMLQELLNAAGALGSPLKDPFMTLSFLALPVIPALKLTDHGLVDVARFQVVPLFLPDNGPEIKT